MIICTLHRCIHYVVNKHELRERQSRCLENTNRLQVKNFTKKVLGEVVFINSVYLVICCMLSYLNFAISPLMTAIRLATEEVGRYHVTFSTNEIASF